MLKKDIAHYYADEHVVRIIAGLVVVIATLALITHAHLAVLFLVIDFALRAFTFQPSPLAALAKIIARTLHLEPYPIFAAPKRFAAGLGFGFSLAVLILLSLNLYTAAWLTGGLLIVCAVLEAAFRICAGCYIFSWIVAPIMRSLHKKEMKQSQNET